MIGLKMQSALRLNNDDSFDKEILRKMEDAKTCFLSCVFLQYYLVELTIILNINISFRRKQWNSMKNI